ncbi:DUF2982 domain-containing protein [Rheinheimera maricola]|uniref:DUF2982 domain-containing protein n=1 Tax=Rheinheimera maricola TaxID=2793282 RepID=A0ABS7X8U4_9GAMM|nr:DUF2982 domain-containing protein [Rheinheimera maricola]MBZ9611965.1 DUF2982 domain-containing protein [Rheinheimera maricola]
MKPIQLEGSSSRGGAAVLLCSSTILVTLLLSLIWIDQVSLLHALAFVLALLGIFAGWAKLSEPRYFLQLDSDGIRYFHRRGSWLLSWHCLQYSGVPQSGQTTLSYIAFKLGNYDAFLQQLPLRLAVRIMTEQRALYLEAVRQGCSMGGCASELLTETDKFSTRSTDYNGIKAAFGWRMQRLADTFGYELYVPVSSTQKHAEQLCREINQARLQCIQNTAT